MDQTVTMQDIYEGFFSKFCRLFILTLFIKKEEIFAKFSWIEEKNIWTHYAKWADGLFPNIGFRDIVH